VTRATAHVTDFAAPGNLGCEAIEQLSIKGFVLEFVENSARILVRELIVTSTDRWYAIVIHHDLPVGDNNALCHCAIRCAGIISR
jgi:hypothetical protein